MLLVGAEINSQIEAAAVEQCLSGHAAPDVESGNREVN
jgi:hypothetical protein